MFGTGLHPYYEQVLQERLNPKPRNGVRPVQTAPVVRRFSLMRFVRERIEALGGLLDRQSWRTCCQTSNSAN